MNSFQINTYESIKKPTVVSTLSIDYWLNQIQTSTYSDQIQKARSGELDYETTKESLPCVTYNFLFDQYKKDSNIISSTGLIYIDIDNPTFDISSIDRSKVYSYYHSFGGNGYAILVKVSGVTMDNFSSTYSHITKELGIAEYVDIQAAKASQYNVLSFDKDIFINDDAYTFPPTLAPHSDVIRKKEKAYTKERGAEYKPLRFDNLDEIAIEGDYQVNWGGYDYIKCFLPFKKISKNRNNFLLSYCTNLVYLNPFITREKTYDIIYSVNHKLCETPVDSNQIWRVVNSINKYHKDGTLVPIYYRKKRKIIFSKQSKLTRDEKLELCRNEVAKRNKQLSQQKLYAILENWDFEKYGAITQRKIYRLCPISKKTVEKYWSHFKAFVKVRNTSG